MFILYLFLFFILFYLYIFSFNCQLFVMSFLFFTSILDATSRFGYTNIGSILASLVDLQKFAITVAFFVHQSLYTFIILF